MSEAGHGTDNRGRPVETWPETVYETAVARWHTLLGPAADVLVRAVTITVGLHPLEAWVKNREEARDRILTALTDKVKNIPPAALISPRPMVAQSAIEGMAGTQEEAEIFDAFANLLANAMVGEHAHKVHPGFPSILKHISASEVRLMQWLFLQWRPGRNKRVPCLRVMAARVEDKHTFFPVLAFYLGERPHTIFNDNPDMIASSLNNLVRLGLLHPPEFDPLRPPPAPFPPLEQEVVVQSLLLRMAQTPAMATTRLDKGYIELTDFGLQFFNACLVPPGMQADRAPLQTTIL